jgi:protein-S-isoprenylcysteine O-methyltransferase Ste14
MFKQIILILAIALILYLTWLTWKQKLKHYLPRFFAFCLVLAQIEIAWDVWFRNPLYWNQLLSWLFLTGSLILVIHCLVILKVMGKPRGEFENTSYLVTSGIYRYIRHPMYLSLLLLGVGAAFKIPSMAGLIINLALVASLFLTARVEEFQNLIRFGEKYKTYSDKTWMFIPYII